MIYDCGVPLPMLAGEFISLVKIYDEGECCHIIFLLGQGMGKLVECALHTYYSMSRAWRCYIGVVFETGGRLDAG